MAALLTSAAILVLLSGLAIVVLLSARKAASAAPASAVLHERAVPRVHAEVHTGWEQTLIGLGRELRLPRHSEDLPYGALYLEPRTGDRQYVHTRSEIGRGFVGAIEVTSHPGPTTIDYFILSLPRDDRLQARVLEFQRDLVAAVHRLDPDAVIRIADDPLLPSDSFELPD